MHSGVTSRTKFVKLDEVLRSLHSSTLSWKNDAVAEWPPLSRVRFEKHFGTVVALLASLVAAHPSVDVIEWGFNCLACLFKYLSKLLVLDLRPTYALMAPLLGREHQKSFVLQFTAEAMAHLTRKAAALSYKNKQPLRLLLEHIFADLNASKESRNPKEYQHGLMLMFSAAARGVKGVMHSSATALLDCIFEIVTTGDSENNLAGEEVLRGTVMFLTYHVQVDGDHPAMVLARKALEETSQGRVTANSRIASSLLLTVAAIKKGSRVASWPPLLDTLAKLLLIVQTETEVESETSWRSCLTTAVVLQQAPLDSLLPRLSRILDILTKGRFAHYFLAFCSLSHQLGKERFHSLLMSHFKRFVLPCC